MHKNKQTKTTGKRIRNENQNTDHKIGMLTVLKIKNAALNR